MAGVSIFVLMGVRTSLLAGVNVSFLRSFRTSPYGVGLSASALFGAYRAGGNDYVSL